MSEQGRFYRNSWKDFEIDVDVEEPKTNSVFVSFRISKELEERILRFAKANNIEVEILGIGNLCRGIIARFLKERGF
jgi:hypothetical protein